MQRHAFDVGAQGGNAFIQHLLRNGEEVLFFPNPGGFNNIFGRIAAAAGHFDMGGAAEHRHTIKAHAAQHRREQQDKNRAAAAFGLLFAGRFGSHGLGFSFFRLYFR